MARTTWIATMAGILGAVALASPAVQFAVAADDEPEFPTATSRATAACATGTRAGRRP